MDKSVVVGMSGGVDSSLCAYLLKEQGYRVTGVSLNLTGISEAEIEDAKGVCTFLGIDHKVVDLRREFKEKVRDYFKNEYLSIRTPNPCIACNKFVKWQGLLGEADKMGAEFVATGHYCSIVKVGERLTIRVPKDKDKDQTYVLYSLSQEELSRTLFPLSAFTKDEVRQLSNKVGLPVANKKESQDICFIPHGDYKAYMEKIIDPKDVISGNFTDTKGNIIAAHKGLHCYTIGQRKNLGVALGRRIFVKSLNGKTGDVVLCDDDELFFDELFADSVAHMGEAHFNPEKTYTARIRYSHRGEECSVSEESGGIRVKFKKPVRAITPGQAVVIYDKDLVAGGGIIKG